MTPRELLELYGARLAIGGNATECLMRDPEREAELAEAIAAATEERKTATVH